MTDTPPTTLPTRHETVVDTPDDGVVVDSRADGDAGDGTGPPGVGDTATVTPTGDDPRVNEAPSHLSPSSASTFEQCPRRWRFRYVERRPEPSGEPALVGTFAHRVLELLCGLPAAHRTLDQAKALAKELWPEFAEDPDYLALGHDDGAGRAFRWQAWLAVNGLWKLEDPAAVEVVSTEQRVSVDLGGVPFLGVIDRVDRVNDRLVVSDYKSGTLPRVRFRGDKIQQVMLYAAALTRSGEEQPDRARLLYLGQRIIEVGVTERRMEEAEEQLAGTWERIAVASTSDEFAPRPGPLCGWCPFADSCPEGRDELVRRAEAGTLPDHAPAASLVA